ncbi:hypothetical protein [Corynebacterium urealyticum]|uniref:hypothetical protein n=1 Tax=Corynebacterium urealyticum TaxID=43771 RepID=UPI0011E779DA|nr:hypothetical protein [Corynebacterium urealyticum]TYR15633.1 hypothetical protein FYJ89_03650 [Corynebacterium urealyticum]TYR17969.1 hypothetical protein FYJ88_03850 [Corynebacterium urealyticum]
MGLSQAQWREHKKHRDTMVEDTGRWIGLLDENGEPMLDCPPVVEAVSPQTRGVGVSGRWVIPCRSGGVVHPMVDELVAENLSEVDAEGRLVPVMRETRFLAVERPGQRRVYRITHVTAVSDGAAPSVLEVHGEDLLSLLNRVPAFSSPTTITGKFVRFKRDWVGDETVESLYRVPRDLQDLRMLTVADGATLDGPAESVIRRVIDTSLDAAFRAVGKPRSIVVDPAGSGVESPYLALTVQDDYLWDTVGAVAMQAGVGVEVSMWWPGDPPVRGLELSAPTMVVSVKQRQEVPSGAA